MNSIHSLSEENKTLDAPKNMIYNEDLMGNKTKPSKSLIVLNAKSNHKFSNLMQKPLNRCRIPLKSLLTNKMVNLFFQKQKDLEKICCKKLKENKVGVTCRRKFTEKEDLILKNAVNIFGSYNWKIIASLVPGRNPRQCRDRYTNYLAPGLVHIEWSEDEDKLLAEKFNLFGPKWTQIRQYFPTRSANDIKNRYNYTVCHKIHKYNLQTSQSQINNLDQSNENNKMVFGLENEEFIDMDEFFVTNYIQDNTDITF